MAKKKQKSGRKPVEPSEKVILVGFYTKQKHVDNLGGIYEARKVAKQYVENFSNKKSLQNLV